MLRTGNPPALKMGSFYSGVVTNPDDLTFTSFNNAVGEQEYKVGIKVASRSTAEFIVTPDTYNGIPVTQIADSGFLSCSKLEKIILPLSLEKIGLNAFMNCSKLKRVSMPRVKSIGANAFGMCNLLERLFIPETVEEVGATILRNNPNTVYVQSSLSEISGWSSTWHDYATGSIEYEAIPAGILQYQEILNENNEVIAYELTEGQFLANVDYDLTIYSSYSPDPGNVAFKPVVNINSQAFTFSQLKSLTIKHRYMDDA